MTDRPVVRPDAAVGDTLAGVGQHILAEARTVIEDRVQPGAEAVHAYRKSMKQWRALLRLLEPFLGEAGAQLRREARDLAHELAGARDYQASLDALSDLAKSETVLSPTSFATMSRRIEQIRQTAEKTALTDAMRERLRHAVNAATSEVSHWPLDRVGFRQLARELARTYRQARRAVPRDWSSAGPDDIHELRKRVVAHRYQMEIVEPLWPRMTRMWVEEAQRLRDRLGAHHDLETLRGLTAPHQPLAPWRSRLVPAMTARQQKHAAAAAKLAGRLFAERPNAFRERLEALWASRGAEID